MKYAMTWNNSAVYLEIQRKSKFKDKFIEWVLCFYIAYK